jgi:hypothetical protein
MSVNARLLMASVTLVAALGLAACGGGNHVAVAPAAQTSSASLSPTSSASSASSASPSTGAPASLPSDEQFLDLHNCQDAVFEKAHAEFCDGGGAASIAAGNPPITEGSVTGPNGASVVYPGDRLRVEIVKVSKEPTGPGHSHYESDHPDFDEIVTVTVQLTNTGTEDIPLQRPANGVSVQLLYGQDRYRATGWTRDGGEAPLPQQLVPGSTTTLRQDFTLPSSGLGTLAVQFNRDVPSPGAPSGSPDYLFTDVQTLLK